MFSQSAELYDLIYSSFKNYETESAKAAGLIRAAHPDAKTILDVACGPGEHARILAEKHGFRVDGIDIEPKFVSIAAGKCPTGKFHRADMTSFKLKNKYDVIVCLFSSIGYVKTLKNVDRTLACFRRHLAPRGIVLVEPWFTPEAWKGGMIFMNTVEKDDVKVCRMGCSTLKKKVSKLSFEYLVGRPGGVERHSEIHELGLFTTAEMTGSFRKNGFNVDYHPTGLAGRGMYIAREPEG